MKVRKGHYKGEKIQVICQSMENAGKGRKRSFKSKTKSYTWEEAKQIIRGKKKM